MFITSQGSSEEKKYVKRDLLWELDHLIMNEVLVIIIL